MSISKTRHNESFRQRHRPRNARLTFFLKLHKYTQVLGNITDVQRTQELADYRMVVSEDFHRKVGVLRFDVFIAPRTHSCGSNLAWEVIVVDDASPDGTQEVAKELAGLYGEDKIVSSHLFRVLGLQMVNVALSIADSQT